MLGQDQSRSAKQSNVKQRHPGFTVSNDAAVTPGRSAKPQETIMSQGVKKLNKDGYAVYNTPEKQDVYITIQPDSAFFDEDEPQMVRMAGGSFVGAKKNIVSIDVPLRSEPEVEPIIYDQPADLFSNASRREEFEEIDFNEIIIKKNESFDEELEKAPVFASFVERFPEPVFVESMPTMMPIVEESQLVMTSTDVEQAVEMPMTSMGYDGVQEYEIENASADVEEEDILIVEEITYEEAPVPEEIMIRGASFRESPVMEEMTLLDVEEDVEISETAEPEEMDIIEKIEIMAEAPVMDAPVGLYIESNEPMDAAEMGVDETNVLSSFMEVSMDAEVAMTSEAAPAHEYPIGMMVEENNYLCLPAPREEPEEIMFETESETIADQPQTYEVLDPVADIMKLTVPGLHMSDDLIAELAGDWELSIPDDGLESYDEKFTIMDVQEPEVTETCSVSFRFEGSESAYNQNPTVNFRF